MTAGLLLNIAVIVMLYGQYVRTNTNLGYVAACATAQPRPAEEPSSPSVTIPVA